LLAEGGVQGYVGDGHRAGPCPAYRSPCLAINQGLDERVGLAPRKRPHGGWRLGMAGRCEADSQATASVTEQGNRSAAWPPPDTSLLSCSSLGAAPVEGRRAGRMG
jgi:hypothetical protein